MSAARPEVTVVLQTYEHAPYVGAALDGVLAQEAPFPFDVVVAEDDSADGTRAIVREYAARHPERLRLLLPERNLGPAPLFRAALGLARGRFVAWLDGDDVWDDPTKLRRQHEALEQRAGWVGCFHDAVVRDDMGAAPDRPYVPAGVGRELTLRGLIAGNVVPSLSVMVRAEPLRELPAWVWERRWTDWLLLLALARHGDLGYLPRTMGTYRAHAGGLSAGMTRADQLREDLAVYALLGEALPDDVQDAVEDAAARRRAELAVEEAGVPYGGAVAVLGPAGRTPTYLNGRATWPVAHGDDPVQRDRLDRSGALAAQLDALREQAAAVPPATPHFRAERVPEGDRRSLHVLCADPPWLHRYSRLGRQLDEAARCVWRSEDCVVHEVLVPLAAPRPMGALLETTAVVLPRPLPPELFGAHLDAPAAGSAGDAHAVTVAGWAIGADAPVVSVELLLDGRPFRRVPLGEARPDLAQVFPERAEAATAAGFRTTVSLVGTAEEVEVEVVAVLAGQRRAPLARFTSRRRWSDGTPASGPLVSVVIPCFAQARFLPEAIESVLAQTYANVEVVVVDDGSTDNAHRVALQHPGVRCVRQDNRGLAAARNAGIRESDGELLVFLDADDRLLPRALEHGVRVLDGHPAAGLAYGRYRRIGLDGARLEDDEQPRTGEPPYQVLLRANAVGTPATAIVRRSALEQVGGFDEDLPAAEDYDLWLRAARTMPVQPHGEEVAEYRQHGTSMSRGSATMLRTTLDVLRRQWPHVRDDAERRAAYDEGQAFWKDYYGAPLAVQARESAANGEWGAALLTAATLARRDPRRAAALARRGLVLPRSAGAALDGTDQVRSALRDDRLAIWAQPVVPLAGGARGEELLVRLVQPGGAVAAASEFLAAAERQGLMPDIDLRVIRAAAALAAAGRRVRVNLSAASVARPGLPEEIAAALRAVNAPPDHLVLEVAERALTRDLGASEHFAAAAGAHGLAVAVDDFRATRAGFAALGRVGVREIKVGLDLVRGLPHDPQHQDLVRAIVGLARGLGQGTVAVGVEDAATLELLRELGLHYAEGWHLGRPAAVDATSPPAPAHDGA